MSDPAKALLRRQALVRREGCDPALGQAMSDRLLAEAPPPRGAVVAGYWPMGREIDCRPLLVALHRRGHAVALPVTPPRGQPLAFRAWSPGAAMARGRFSTAEPAAGDLLRPDWLLVPLLAFDRTGGRLGYGAGYYDRTLALLGGVMAVGAAFSCQEVEAVPMDSHDIRLDAVATESELIRCAPPA